MSLATDRALIISMEVSSASGVTVTPSIIAELLAALMSVLTTCIPVASVQARMAKPGLFIQAVIISKSKAIVTNVDSALMYAAIMDEAQSLTSEDWIKAYKGE
jgi:hypothetical protein